MFGYSVGLNTSRCHAGWTRALRRRVTGAVAVVAAGQATTANNAVVTTSKQRTEREKVAAASVVTVSHRTLGIEWDSPRRWSPRALWQAKDWPAACSERYLPSVPVKISRPVSGSSLSNLATIEPPPPQGELRPDSERSR
jgi:hypothetical protein